jgi:hypothetical protein
MGRMGGMMSVQPPPTPNGYSNGGSGSMGGSGLGGHGGGGMGGGGLGVTGAGGATMTTSSGQRYTLAQRAATPQGMGGMQSASSNRLFNGGGNGLMRA